MLKNNKFQNEWQSAIKPLKIFRQADKLPSGITPGR
jgi:hypothetical protein